MHYILLSYQKKLVFYLAVTRSISEHCAQVWRPTSDSAIQKIERIQKRAVKWILSEMDHSYTDFGYLTRLKKLELLPFKYKFIFSDLLLFHGIFYQNTCIELPQHYIKYSIEERKRLRSVIKPPDYFGSGVQTIDLQKPRNNKNYDLSLKCTLLQITMYTITNNNPNY